jgi:small subunit ribosomal protein S10
MPFVTTLSLQSGDRTALDAVVEEVRETARRKGIELKGPHTDPTIECHAPLYWNPHGGGSAFGTWDYAVYERTIRIVGHEEIARRIAGREFPESVRIEVDVEQVRSAGSR